MSSAILAVYEFNHPANFLNGLIAYYPFTDGSTEDFSGNGNHGIANNVDSVQDRFGNAASALYFSNTDTTNDSFVEVVWTSELRTAFIMQLLARLFIEVIFSCFRYWTDFAAARTVYIGS